MITSTNIVVYSSQAVLTFTQQVVTVFQTTPTGPGPLLPQMFPLKTSPSPLPTVTSLPLPLNCSRFSTFTPRHPPTTTLSPHPNSHVRSPPPIHPPTSSTPKLLQPHMLHGWLDFSLGSYEVVMVVSTLSWYLDISTSFMSSQCALWYCSSAKGMW